MSRRAFGSVIRQARAYQEYWHAPTTGDLVYIVLGDSAALSVGAPDPQQGYVGLLSARLMRATGRSIRVINLAVSGERAADLLRRQVPRLKDLPDPHFVTCVVGGNDVAFHRFGRPYPVEAFTTSMTRIMEALPQHAIIGAVPSFGHWPFENRVRQANDVIRRITRARGMAFADLYEASRPLWPFRYTASYVSRDLFHPNARGHRLWADALWPHLQAQLDDERVPTTRSDGSRQHDDVPARRRG